MHSRRLRVLALSALASLTLSAPAIADDNPWGNRVNEHARNTASFALIGDTPYGTAAEPKFDRVIKEINNARQVRFVIHTGDIKAGSERCDDALLMHRFEQYQTFRTAFVLTPGDNDWTDCHRSNNGGYNPVERLAKLREIFYPVPGMSTGGKPMRVHTQAFERGFETFVENQLWSFSGATIATLHVIGSNNDLAPWNQIDASDSYENPRADRIAEYQARETANLAWIERIFAHARATRASGVLIAMQANPNFDLPASDLERRGFNTVLDAITRNAIAYGKPVMIAHGDSHYFRVDKPLNAPDASGATSLVTNVTRVENFGSANIHWVEIEVDPRDENVFRVIQHIVAANAPQR